jgi:hypothetical protein
VAALALITSAAISACGTSLTGQRGQAAVTTATAPVRFTLTATVPTITVPTPTSRSYIGPEGVPIETGQFLASAITTPLGAIVDGIQCQGLQQLAYRAYAHLQVYVRGRSRALPGGIGLVDPVASVSSGGLLFSPQTCYYWLHTRAADGVIQVNSPIARRYTLGDLFTVWSQPLSRKRVAGARGKVTAIVNGKPWLRDPSQIPLKEHESIELAVGRPVPAFTPVDWASTGF